jgi:hypothetical protein
MGLTQPLQGRLKHINAGNWFRESAGEWIQF